MCSAKDWIESPPMSTHCNRQQKHQHSGRYNVRVYRLITRRRRFDGTKTANMELKNLQLHLENKSIIEENEKLRLKAVRLREENQLLLLEYQKKTKSC